jgi:hypothetical protein
MVPPFCAHRVIRGNHFLLRDERRLIVDTRKFLAKHPGRRSFLYLNWGERENEGMNQSCTAMKNLLTANHWSLVISHWSLVISGCFAQCRFINEK